MKPTLESGAGDAFILEDADGLFYFLNWRAGCVYGPAELARLTRHDRWRPFRGDEALVLERFEKAERIPPP